MTTDELLDSLVADFNYIKTEAGVGRANTSVQTLIDEFNGISDKATESLADINLFKNPPAQTNFDLSKWESYNGRLEAMAPLARITWTAGSFYTLQSKSGTLQEGAVGRVFTATASVRAASSSSLNDPIRIVIRERTGTTHDTGTVVDEASSTSVPLGSTQEFQTISVSYTAKQQGTHIDVRISQSGGGTGDAFHVQNVVITSQNAPDPTPNPNPNPVGEWPFSIAAPVRPTTIIDNATGSITSDNLKSRVYRNANLSGVWLNGAGVTDVWFEGGQIGGITDAHPTIAPVSGGVPKRIVFDGVRFHDMRRSGPSIHTEGLQIGGVEALIVRNCTFVNCDVMDLFLRCWDFAGGTIRYVLIENNYFGAVGSGGFYSLFIGGNDDTNKPTDIVVRNNKWESQGFNVDNTAVRVTLTNNSQGAAPTPTTNPITLATFEAYNADIYSTTTGGQYTVKRNTSNASETYFSFVSKAGVVPDTTATRKYTATVQVKNGTAGAGKSMALVLRERNSGGTEVSRTEKPFVPTSALQTVTVEHLATAASNKMDVYVTMRGAAEGDNFVTTLPAVTYQDEAVPNPPAPVPGGASANVRPFDPAHPIYQPIPANCPLASYSASCVNYIASSHRGIGILTGGETPPMFIGKATDPVWSLSIQGRTFRVHAPSGLRAGGGSDYPLIVLDEASPDFGGLPVEYRMWQARVNGTSRTVSCSGGGVGVYANNGVRHSYGRGGRALGQAEIHGQNTGSGESYSVGMVRPFEVAAGHIQHALRVAVGYPANSGWVWPAIKTETWGGGTPPYVPMGSRIFLPPTTDWNALGAQACANQGITNALNIKLARLLFRAIVEYGMCPLDGTGGGQAIYMEDNITANWPAVAGPFNSVGTYNSIGRGMTAVMPWTQLRIAAPSVFNNYAR